MKPKTKPDISARDDLFLQIIELLPLHWGGLRHLAELSNVTPQTLWNWKYGTTIAPRLSTIIKVADALGYDVVLRRATGRRKLRVVR